MYIHKINVHNINKNIVKQKTISISFNLIKISRSDTIPLSIGVAYQND